MASFNRTSSRWPSSWTPPKESELLRGRIAQLVRSSIKTLRQKLRHATYCGSTALWHKTISCIFFAGSPLRRPGLVTWKQLECARESLDIPLDDHPTTLRIRTQPPPDWYQQVLKSYFFLSHYLYSYVSTCYSITTCGFI